MLCCALLFLLWCAVRLLVAELIQGSGLGPLVRMLQGHTSRELNELVNANEATDPSRSGMPRVSSLASIATQPADNSPPHSECTSPCGGWSPVAAEALPAGLMLPRGLMPPTAASFTARMRLDLERAVAAAAAKAPGTAAASLPPRLGLGLASALLREHASRCPPAVAPAPSAPALRAPSVPNVSPTLSASPMPVGPLAPETFFLTALPNMDEPSRTALPNMGIKGRSSPLRPISGVARAASAFSAVCASDESRASSPQSADDDPDCLASAPTKLPALGQIQVLDEGTPGAALPRIANLSQGCSDGLLLLSATACLVQRREAPEAPGSFLQASGRAVGPEDNPSAKRARTASFTPHARVEPKLEAY